MDSRLVNIASFGSTAEAHLAIGRLEAEGIPACLGGETTGDMFWHVGAAFGVKLYVFEDQADKAHAILAACEPSIGDVDGEEEQAPPLPEYDEEDESPGDEEREGHIRRAWIAAVLGLVICPPLLNIYSLYLLVVNGLLFPAQPSPGQWRVTAALIVDLAALGAAIALWWSLMNTRASE